MAEALVVVMVAMTVRLEVDVGWKLHGAIWKAVWHSIMLAWTLVMVGVRVRMRVVLVARELVEALHTETLHLVAGSLSRRFGLGHAGDHLGEDAAQNGLTLGVWGVWRERDGLGRVEDELENVSVEFHDLKTDKGEAYRSILFFDSCDLDIVNLDYLAIKTHDSHKDSDERIVFKFLLVILHAVAESQVAVVALHIGRLAILFVLGDVKGRWQRWIGNRIKGNPVEFDRVAFSLELHLELALNVVSPFMSTISLGAESKRASRAVQIDRSAVGLDESG